MHDGNSICTATMHVFVRRFPSLSLCAYMIWMHCSLCTSIWIIICPKWGDVYFLVGLIAINNSGFCRKFGVGGPTMTISDSALMISTNTPSMILHLDTIRNGMTYEVLAKSGKYLTRATFLDCVVFLIGFIAFCWLISTWFVQPASQTRRARVTRYNIVVTPHVVSWQHNPAS